MQASFLDHQAWMEDFFVTTASVSAAHRLDLLCHVFLGLISRAHEATPEKAFPFFDIRDAITVFSSLNPAQLVPVAPVIALCVVRGRCAPSQGIPLLLSVAHEFPKGHPALLDALQRIGGAKLLTQQQRSMLLQHPSKDIRELMIRTLMPVTAPSVRSEVSGGNSTPSRRAAKLPLS